METLKWPRVTQTTSRVTAFRSLSLSLSRSLRSFAHSFPNGVRTCFPKTLFCFFPIFSLFFLIPFRHCSSISSLFLPSYSPQKSYQYPRRFRRLNPLSSRGAEYPEYPNIGTLNTRIRVNGLEHLVYLRHYYYAGDEYFHWQFWRIERCQMTDFFFFYIPPSG